MNNFERIKLQSGDFINLSDIPNEQVFNLVKGCFINAGFNTESEWECVYVWKVFHAYSKDRACFAGHDHYNSMRQVSLSDVLNSVNGGFYWHDSNYVHFFKDGYISYSNDKVMYSLIDTHPIKRIPDEVQAIIPPKTSQWWDYEKGCAVGLPEKGELVLNYDRETVGVIYTMDNGVNKVCLLLAKNPDKPYALDTEWVPVVYLKPLDYKSPKQVAVDKALKLVEFGATYKDYTERLYEAGLLKGGE